MHYPEQVHPVSGWAHHTIYVLVVEYALRARLSHIFALAAFLELPTAFLALGTLHPTSVFRVPDIPFAIMFFITRVLLNAVLLVQCVLPASMRGGGVRTEVLGGSWLPAVMLSAALGMHLVWFAGSVRRVMKVLNKEKARREAEKARGRKGYVEVVAKEKMDKTQANTYTGTPSKSLLSPSTPPALKNKPTTQQTSPPRDLPVRASSLPLRSPHNECTTVRLAASWNPASSSHNTTYSRLDPPPPFASNSDATSSESDSEQDEPEELSTPPDVEISVLDTDMDGSLMLPGGYRSSFYREVSSSTGMEGRVEVVNESAVAKAWRPTLARQVSQELSERIQFRLRLLADGGRRGVRNVWGGVGVA